MSAPAAVVQEQSLVWPRTVSPTLPFAVIVGFYLSFRLFFPLIAVRLFGVPADAGAILSLLLNYFLLLAALAGAAGPAPRTLRSILRQPCYRWICFFLGFSGLSLIWSVAASLPAAIAFWCAMAADTVTVILLLRSYSTEVVANSLFRGYIWGSCLIAIIAWLMPAQSDLRLGDEELLGPNQIGWSCAFAFFLAQYLMRRRASKCIPHLVLLGITLLRSLSKTTLIAFAAGQVYILVRDRSITRRTKLALVVSALVVLILFSGLLANYYTIYANTGNQAETLTGRLSIWLYVLNEALQRPWLGHGFHSVWKVIPSFGEFEARHAHNELLQQFYSYGVVGILLLLGTYGSVWWQLRHLPDRSLRIFFIGMLVFVFVRGIADTEVFDLSLPMWCIALIGALIQVFQDQKRSLA
jgi:exopolysaccharide production protein ExoQ